MFMIIRFARIRFEALLRTWVDHHVDNTVGNQRILIARLSFGAFCKRYMLT